MRAASGSRPSARPGPSRERPAPGSSLRGEGRPNDYPAPHDDAVDRVIRPRPSPADWPGSSRLATFPVQQRGDEGEKQGLYRDQRAFVAKTEEPRGAPETSTAPATTK